MNQLNPEAAAFAASAPGKAVLFGEYGVLAGGHAIAVAVNRRLTLTAAPARAGKPGWPGPHAANLALSYWRRRGARLASNLEVTVEAEGFTRPAGTKIGLGKSAAELVVGTIVGLAASGEPFQPSSLALVAEHARAAVVEALEDPGSGLDIATCALGGYTGFGPEGFPGARVSAPPPDLQWVLFDTGQTANTRFALAAYNTAARAKSAEFLAAIGSLKAAAAAAWEAWHAQDTFGVIKAVRAQARGLEALAPLLRQDIALAAKHPLRLQAESLGGALKYSGAGGGDIAVGFFSSEAMAAHFSARAVAHGWQALDVRAELQGGRAEFVRPVLAPEVY